MNNCPSEWKSYIGVKKEKWDQLYHGLYYEGKTLRYIRLTKEQATIVINKLI